MSDAEWALVRDLLPVPGWLAGRGGRPEGYCHRQMIDAVRYLVDNGIKWRAMPSDFPPWPRVYAFFARWRDTGLVAELHDRLREAIRTAEGRSPRRRGLPPRLQNRPHRWHPPPPRHIGQQRSETPATTAISCLNSRNRTRGSERERPLKPWGRPASATEGFPTSARMHASRRRGGARPRRARALMKGRRFYPAGMRRLPPWLRT
ncbi:transposase [Streptomyces sp. NPDC052727]|uniref:transposase n=1 Tax=Streptomyces sp. NPDC052727 TaxID=3154854 RepID=UPI00341C2594